MRVVILLGIILLFGCRSSDKIKFDLPNDEYAVLKYQSDWYWIFDDAKPTNLTDYELNEIELILLKFEKERTDLKLKGYKRQYIPIINSMGQKEVWVNFFCDDGGFKYWKHDLFLPSDGGDCHYQLKVNLDTETYYNIRVNGVA